MSRRRVLSEPEVARVVALIHKGYSNPEIASKVGTSVSLIWCIRNGLSYSEVTGIKPARDRYRQTPKRTVPRQISDDVVLAVARAYHKTNDRVTDIASRFGISVATVSEIGRGYRYHYLTGIEPGWGRQALGTQAPTRDGSSMGNRFRRKERNPEQAVALGVRYMPNKG